MDILYSFHHTVLKGLFAFLKYFWNLLYMNTMEAGCLMDLQFEQFCLHTHTHTDPHTHTLKLWGKIGREKLISRLIINELARGKLYFMSRAFYRAKQSSREERNACFVSFKW